MSSAAMRRSSAASAASRRLASPHDHFSRRGGTLRPVKASSPTGRGSKYSGGSEDNDAYDEFGDVDGNTNVEYDDEYFNEERDDDADRRFDNMEENFEDFEELEGEFDQEFEEGEESVRDDDVDELEDTNGDGFDTLEDEFGNSEDGQDADTHRGFGEVTYGSNSSAGSFVSQSADEGQVIQSQGRLSSRIQVGNSARSATLTQEPQRSSRRGESIDRGVIGRRI